MKINKSRAENIGIIITIATCAIALASLIVDSFNGDFTRPLAKKIIPWIVIIIASLVVLFCIYLNKKKQRHYIKKRLDNNPFRNYWKREDNNPYIPLDIATKQSERHNFYKYFISIINKKLKDSQYICLLGDSGSGKTDALVHLFMEYVEKRKPYMPSKIELYTFNERYSKVLEEIEKIPAEDRENCILLLDALDECDKAKEALAVNTPDNNPAVFMNKIAADTKDFAFVVVSCRNQFFMKKEYAPGKTDIRIGNPPGADPFLHWKRLYIVPFNKKQVEKYLNNHFGGFKNRKKHKEACRIVLECKDLFLRPMILSNIDILLEKYNAIQRHLSMKEIYDTIVMYWIEREAESDEKKIKKLLNFSLCMAAYMFKYNLNSVDDNNYKNFREEYEIDDSDNLLRVKSLLNNNNDDNGLYQFSHGKFQ